MRVYLVLGKVVSGLGLGDVWVRSGSRRNGYGKGAFGIYVGSNRFGVLDGKAEERGRDSYSN